jgi:preprotein translocase subunit SecG
LKIGHKCVKLSKKLGERMETVLIVISVLLIALVLLQSNKASDSSQIITGGNSMLMGNAKERGAEKVITRITYLLGFAFIAISFIVSYLM